MFFRSNKLYSHFITVAKTALFISSSSLLISCFANQNRLERYSKIESELKMDNYQGSLSQVSSKSKYSKKDRLIYYMDNGILNFYSKNNKDAFRYLEQADVMQEDLYTQSVSDNIATYLINDNQRKYAGEDFEIIYLNVFKALAFIRDDKPEEAMVEIRKGINKLSVMEIRYQKQVDKLKKSAPKEFEQDGKLSFESELGSYNFYDSALMRLLTMVLYRNNREFDDAEISKRKIEEIWRLYPAIYDFEHMDLNKIALDDKFQGAKLSIFAFSGLTAQKKPWDLDVFTGDGYMTVTSATPGLVFSRVYSYHGDVGSFSISIPYIERRNNEIAFARIIVDGQDYGNLDLVERISNLSINQFEKKKSFILIKSLIRASIKAAATYALEKKADEKEEKGEDNTGLLIAGFFSSIVASATEVADIRSWNTLPDNCYFGEIELKTGLHKIEIQYLAANGRTVKSEVIDLEVSPDKKYNILMSYGI